MRRGLNIARTVPLFAVIATSLAGCSQDARSPVTPQPVESPQLVAAPVARLTVQIDSYGSTAAISNVTQIRFDASSSDASRPVFRIQFDDGVVEQKAIVVRTCGRVGVLNAQVTVTDQFGRVSTASASVRCKDLSSTWGWVNVINNQRAGRREIRFLTFRLPSSAMLAGSYQHPEGYGTPFTGTIDGNNDMRLVLDDGTIVFEGHAVMKDYPTMVLGVRGGSADGMVLDFNYFDPY